MTHQSNDKNTTASYIPEVVSLSLAILSWVLPDISLLTKIVISGTLVGILLVSKLNLLRFGISYQQYAAVVFWSIVTGFLEFTACGFIVYFLFQSSVELIYQFMQYGLVYGILIGIPIQLISISRKDDASGSEAAGLAGCFTSVFLFIVIYFSLATSISINLSQGIYTLNLFTILAGPGTILVWWILSALNWFSTITAGFAMLIFPYLQNLQFGAIARFIKRAVK